MSALEIKEKLLNTLVITKEVASQQLLLRELVGGALFDQVQGGMLSVGVEKGKLVTRKVAGASLLDAFDSMTVNQQEKEMLKLGKILASVKKAHDQGGFELVDEVIGLLGFLNFVEKNLAFLEKTDQVDSAVKEVLLKDLLSLRKIPKNELTLIHGDLNLGNIMKLKDKLVLIDFEHVIEGPIELELAPSLLWQDKASLPTQKFVKTLKEVGFEISPFRVMCALSLYLVNQIRVANAEGDHKKIRLLKKLAKKAGIIN